MAFHTESGPTYNLLVSTHQMCVLNLFNDHDELTMSKMVELLNPTNSGDLKRCLQSLTCVKGRNVLRKTPAGRTIRPNDTFSINESFTSSEETPIRIGMVAEEGSAISGQQEKEQQEEQEQQLAVLLEEQKYHRRPLIEATIVGVMKRVRKTDHATLVNLVQEKLETRINYSFRPPLLKQIIEDLIEKDFLSRDADDHRVYHYVS